MNPAADNNGETSAAPEAAGSPRQIWSWALYDFANSAFTTLVVTFIYAAFFTKKMAADEIAGTALWSRGVTITAISVALLSPFLGALADRGGHRKRLLMSSTIVCVTATALLFYPKPGGQDALLALGIFVVANVAFEMSNVFYNAFLPDLAPAGKLGRISGWGWALGYVGGLLCMVVALFFFVMPETPIFGLDKGTDAHVRATNLLVAAWFAIFSLPMLLLVRDPERQYAAGNLWKETISQLRSTFASISDYRQIVRLLVARLVYNDGLVTVFAFGGVYAAGTFGFELQEILIFGIVLNITAGIGAFAMSYLDDFVGGKKTLLITLGGLMLGTLVGALAPTKTWFWVAGVLIGVFSGPNQAASRSLLARFVPDGKENEFFGFFAFSGKATAFLGPLLFGILTEAFGTQRAGIAAVVASFILGAVLLTRVNEAHGIAQSRTH